MDGGRPALQDVLGGSGMDGGVPALPDVLGWSGRDAIMLGRGDRACDVCSLCVLVMETQSSCYYCNCVHV